MCLAVVATLSASSRARSSSMLSTRASARASPTDATDAIIQVYVDPANMAVGDEYVLRVYETVRSGGTKRVVEEWTLMGAQSEALVTPSMLVMHGWDVTLQKVAGTDRAFDLSIRKVS